MNRPRPYRFMADIEFDTIDAALTEAALVGKVTVSYPNGPNNTHVGRVTKVVAVTPVERRVSTDRRSAERRKEVK